MAEAARRAIVTGAGSGIGAATAALLADQGYTVTAIDRAFPDTPRAGIETHTLDLRDIDDARDLVSGLRGDLRVLVNVAAIRPEGSVLEETPDAFRIAFEVNVVAPFVLMQTAARRMDPGGSIVNVSSAAALGKPNLAAYGATKAALVSLTVTAAMELDRRGIRVNAVLPGTTDTPMLSAARAGSGPQHRPRPRNMGGQVLAPQTVAGGIVRVAADPALSGAVVPIGLLPVAW